MVGRALAIELYKIDCQGYSKNFTNKGVGNIYRKPSSLNVHMKSSAIDMAPIGLPRNFTSRNICVNNKSSMDKYNRSSKQHLLLQ